jgi:hypothetical protein
VALVAPEHASRLKWKLDNNQGHTSSKIATGGLDRMGMYEARETIKQVQGMKSEPGFMVRLNSCIAWLHFTYPPQYHYKADRLADSQSLGLSSEMFLVYGNTALGFVTHSHVTPPEHTQPFSDVHDSLQLEIFV